MHIKRLLRRKNDYIQALRRQLKLPTIEHPQTQENGELEKEKEIILSYLIEQNLEIQKMKERMEVVKREDPN